MNLNKIGKVATAVIQENFGTKVKYHNTVVVEFDIDQIILNSGGWKTLTTKNRMNQTSNEYNLGFQVFQKDFDWYVDFDGKIIPFKDGMILERNK